MRSYRKTLTTLAVAVAAALLLPPAARAAEPPLAVFELREITGRDWPRTLVTYQVSGVRNQESVRLVNAATGEEVPFQFWRVRANKDDTIASARISFYASLPSGGSYRFELQSGKPAPVKDPLKVSTGGGQMTLDNGITAIRLPAGKEAFKVPLRFATDHAEAAAAGFDKLEKAGRAFGPIAGVRLADGVWVGGSYFTYEPIEVVRKRQNYLQEVPANAWERATAAGRR